MADSEKKVKREIQKSEYLKNEKRYYLGAIIWGKSKNSGHKL